MFTRSLMVISTILLSSSSSPAGDDFFFYSGVAIGSEPAFHPITMLFNNTYGIMAAANRSNKIGDIEYSIGASNVWDNLTSAAYHVNRYGWKKFFTNEVFPNSVKLKNAQWWPNYTNHLIGGGMLFRYTADWYESRSIPHPRLSSYLTIMAMHFSNEVVENNSFKGTNIDPIADLLLFDNLGVLLFSSEGVARFFGRKLNMKDWSLQPAIHPLTGEIENAAQNYMIRHNVHGSGSTLLFYYWGNNGMLGISRARENGDYVSMGGGLILKDLVELEEETGIRKVTTNLVWTAGFFYDREGSLLSNLILSGTKRYSVLLNIYPGVIKIKGASPGMYVAVDKDGDVTMGVRFTFFPVGLAAF